MPKQSLIITVVPFIGGLPLKFGMMPEEVTAQVGPPESSRALNSDCDLIEYRPWANLEYGNHGLDAIDCWGDQEVKMVFDGVDLFKHPDPIRFLMDRGSRPVDYFGLIFLEYGIAMPEDLPLKDICLFSKTVRDEYAAKNKPRWIPRQENCAE